MLIQKNEILRAGNYLIHIGTYKTTDVAIISKRTMEVVQFKNILRGGKLDKLKRKFNRNLCSTTEFYFSFVQPTKLQEIVEFLKQK